MLKIHKPKCENNDITTARTSPDSDPHWKKHFHKIYADFEADNEKDNFSMGNRPTNIYKQNPVLNGYEIVSELEDVLKSGYHKSPLAYNNVYWFVNEVKKLKNKMAFYFKTTKKDIIMTEKDEEDFKNINNCRFCEKKF